MRSGLSPELTNETAVIREERRKYLAHYDAKASHYEVASAQRIVTV